MTLHTHTHTQATAQARIFGGRGGPLLPAPALSRVSQFALAVSAAQFDTALRNQHALGTRTEGVSAEIRSDNSTKNVWVF